MYVFLRFYSIKKTYGVHRKQLSWIVEYRLPEVAGLALKIACLFVAREELTDMYRLCGELREHICIEFEVL